MQLLVAFFWVSHHVPVSCSSGSPLCSGASVLSIPGMILPVSLGIPCTLGPSAVCLWVFMSGWSPCFLSCHGLTYTLGLCVDCEE